ncbi:MAG: lipopolysaccharide biosynthesis protein [Acidobacteriota bacterium]
MNADRRRAFQVPIIATFLTIARQRLGIDRAVAYTAFGRIWSSLSGIVSVVLIAHLLSPTEQGYYYTFASLIALQLVFELGFTQVVMQLASHERAHLVIEPDGQISGDETAHARLASILQLVLRWYFLAAFLFVVALIPAGLYFFSSHQHLGSAAHWKAPWICAATVAGFGFFLDPLFAFSEGCGYVAEVAHMRFKRAILGNFLGWAALAAHHGLYAPALVLTGQVLVGSTWLWGRRAWLLGLLRLEVGRCKVSWKREIWPFQWRIAVSWISGYFVYQSFNPILFAYKGPAAAGRMGMSLSIANSLMFFAMAWVSTKAAPFGMLIAKKRYAELDSIFFKTLLQSTGVALAGAAILWAGVAYLSSIHSPYSYKILSPLTFGLLLAAAIVNHLFASMATYLRAHKQEVLFQLSLAIAVAVLFSNFISARTVGAPGMVTGYLVILAILGLGGGFLYFVKYRALWHSSGVLSGRAAEG